MSFKVIPNISTIFTSAPMIQRLSLAKRAGFDEVEMQFPYEAGSPEKWLEVRETSGCKVALLNMFPGNLKDGELGCACHPNATDQFKQDLTLSIEYCKALECKRLHVVAGKRQLAYTQEEMMETYISNIKTAVSMLDSFGIECVIEPINSVKSVPGYFLDSPKLALSVIETVQHNNLKLQFDFFHFQLFAGNLTGNFKQLLPHIGHVQLAQVPNRDEPDQPGEINYEYIFDLLRSCNYSGRVGAEYNQTKDDTFSWISKYNLSKAT